MSNTMNFVGEQEHFHQNPPEQYNLPVCWCNGVPINELMNMIRRTVEEVIDRKLPSTSSSLPPQAEPSVSKTFRLCLKGTMPDTILTMDNIEDQDASLELQLCDDTGKRVEEVDPEMKNLKVMISVLEGFKFDDSDNFTVEAFESKIAKPREGKPQLLKGNYEISLINGCARVHGISFTDNSAKRSGGKFKLGARVIKGIPFGEVVRPAVSEAFQVKEYRLKGDLKHPKPFPQDDISRLTNITKTGDGKFYQRAVAQEILTVLDFLQLYYTDATKLQNNLKLTGKRWKKTVENAEACNLTNELYKYKYFDDASGDVLIMNCAFKIESVTFKDQAIQPYESLDQFQKEKVCELRKTAYEKRKELKKVYSSTNHTPIQAGLRYPCNVQQPATAPFSMDSNVSGLWGSAGVTGVSSYNMDSTSFLNTVTDQGSFGQQSACAITGYGESSTNIAIGNMAQQFPNGFACQISDSTAANQDHFQQDGMITPACLSTGISGVTCRGQTSQLIDPQYNFQKVHSPMYQNSVQNEQTHPSGIIQKEHHQGHQHQQPAAAPYSVSEYPHAGHALNRMSSVSPSNFLHVDPTTSFQGTMCDSSFENGGFQDLLELLEDPATPPPQEERSNVSARDSGFKKLIITRYVITYVARKRLEFRKRKCPGNGKRPISNIHGNEESAAVFMMSVQQDPIFPMKKQKHR